MLTIDGESGGGQILRTSLFLSAILGKPIKLINIRGNRKPKDGLQAQHLMCVTALASIIGARVEGAIDKSTELVFVPPDFTGKQRPIYPPPLDGTVFDIGSAGSTMLVLQTLLPVLLFSCSGQSRIIIRGGTHNGLSPSSTFILETFFPILRMMGLQADGIANRIGFYPAGGGEFEVVVLPFAGSISLDLTTPKKIQSVEFQILHSAPVQGQQDKNTRRILENLQAFEKKISESSLMSFCERSCVVKNPQPAGGFGISLLTKVSVDHMTMVFTSIDGKHDLNKILQDCEKQMHDYFVSTCQVDEFLADQLLLPGILCAIFGKTHILFKSTMLSEHFFTNLEVLEKFFGKGIVKLESDEPLIAGMDGSHVTVKIASPK